MAVIPLTLVVSLCLVFTFVVFFLVEHSRNRFGSAESQSILPLAEETPRIVRERRSEAEPAVPAVRTSARRGAGPARPDCSRPPAS